MLKRGRPEWQPVFRDLRCDRMTDRLIEAVPLHHIANSDPQSVTPVTILFLWLAMKTLPQFVWEACQKNTHTDWINTKKILHVGETYLKYLPLFEPTQHKKRIQLNETTEPAKVS